MILMFNNDGI